MARTRPWSRIVLLRKRLEASECLMWFCPLGLKPPVNGSIGRLFAMIADLAMPVPHVLTPADVLREVKHLPSAPRVLPRLKDLLGDGNSAMDDIVGLIRLDPSMAARVLQVSNSAYFSKGVRCLTVEEAVNRVGYDQVYELVSFAAASQVLVRPLEVYGIEPDDLWRMSVACAMAADLLAERTGQDRSIAYTIGLLHSIGMVAINEWALRCRRGLKLPLESFPREAAEADRVALGFTQAEMGGTLLHEWQLAAPIVEPRSQAASTCFTASAARVFGKCDIRQRATDGTAPERSPPCARDSAENERTPGGS